MRYTNLFAIKCMQRDGVEELFVSLGHFYVYFENREFMLFSLLIRQECWKLTWCGRFLLTAFFVIIPLFTVLGVYPFLAITHKVSARVLVIEGWMQANSIKRAIEEYRSGQYEKLLLIQPILDAEDQNEPGHNCRNWVATWIIQQGIPKEQMATLYPRVAMKDRTYHAASAVRDWLKAQGLANISINVVTQGPHARRSRLLYQKVFGDSLKVGIISLRSLEYDPTHWWRTSAGVREVIGESIAYFYVRFFFNPPIP